jgi:hypothetical protein
MMNALPTLLIRTPMPHFGKQNKREQIDTAHADIKAYQDPGTGRTLPEVLAQDCGAMLWRPKIDQQAPEAETDPLTLRIDRIGNADPATAYTTPRWSGNAMDMWYETIRAKVDVLFQQALGRHFPDIQVLPLPIYPSHPSPPGYNAPICCRKGCHGCLNGTSNALIHLLRCEPPVITAFSAEKAADPSSCPK